MVLSCDPYTPSNSTNETTTRNELLAIYKTDLTPLGVMTDQAITLDSVSGHVSTNDLAARYNAVRSVMAQLPVGNIGVDPVQTQIANDAALLTSLKNEYCFYYGRYRYALDKWLGYATNRGASQSSQAQDMLTVLRTLNTRVIFLIEFINYVAQDRATNAQADTASIELLNTAFNAEYTALQNTQALLKDQNAIVMTQKEMVRYTASKNSAAMATVLFWGVANVIALGAIGAVYTMM